jgi:hypothetical protein
VYGPHFRCCDSLGLERTRCLPEELLEQLCIGGTLRHGILDKSCAPIAAPLTVKFKIVKHQGRAEGKKDCRAPGSYSRVWESRSQRF